MTIHHISQSHLSIEKVKELTDRKIKIALSEEAEAKISRCRQYLDDKMANGEGVFYGINTGFGSLCDTVISKGDLSQLQRNLVLSHACGIGEEVPGEIVKLMLLLKVQGLSYGHSGVQLATVNRLIDFYNHDILPVIYQQGSLGASGDLAPLAHMSLPLLGEGMVRMNGELVSSKVMLEKMGWEALTLQSKEGLALLNGTQFMSAYGVWILMRAQQLAYTADLIGAISVEAFDGRLNPFFENVNRIRNQQGQIKTAEQMRLFLQGSEIINQPKKHVQDPYSFRCIPQVHGASKDAIDYAITILNAKSMRLRIIKPFSLRQTKLFQRVIFMDNL